LVPNYAQRLAKNIPILGPQNHHTGHSAQILGPRKHWVLGNKPEGHRLQS
jgi:hypothetical protein